MQIIGRGEAFTGWMIAPRKHPDVFILISHIRQNANQTVFDAVAFSRFNFVIVLHVHRSSLGEHFLSVPIPNDDHGGVDETAARSISRMKATAIVCPV